MQRGAMQRRAMQRGAMQRGAMQRGAMQHGAMLHLKARMDGRVAGLLTSRTVWVSARDEQY